MKQVFTEQDTLHLYHLKNLLEAEGIECVIKNEKLSSLAGELPMTSTWPELWVIDTINALKAVDIIEKAKEPLINKEKWICKNCGEKHSAQFIECWNCQNIKAF